MKDKEWIIAYIAIKEKALDFAYCHGDIEAAKKIEEDIKRLKIMYVAWLNDSNKDNETQ